MFKKTVSGILLFLLCVSTLTLAFNIQPVKAAGSIYIRADGSIDPPTAPVSTSDNITYTLTSNIYNDSIFVERDNIIVDGGNHSAEYTGITWYYSVCVSLNNRSNVTIRNMRISNFSDAIYFDSSRNCNISNNIFTLNQGTGVCLTDLSNYNSISGNSFTGGGVTITDSSYTTVSGNNMTGGLLLLSNSRWNNIVGNVFVRSGLSVTRNCRYNYMIDNTVNNKKLAYLEAVSFEKVEDAGQVVLVDCSNIRVEDLDLSDTPIGILLLNTKNTEMADNILTNNGWYGIRLIDSRNNTISGNNQTHAHYGGIRLSSSSNNTISNNNITSNDDGVYVESSSNNIICHNNFVENSRQVRSTSSANSWDDGDTSGGNYWSDYSSTDIYSGPYQNETGSDGKGDTPYVIDANNRDRYPLMNPWIITPPTPPPKFRVGDQVRTTANLKVREGPGLGHTIVSIVPEGALGQILGGPVEADGYTWWDVDYDIGVRGWSAEDWLEEWFELNNPPFPPISLSQSKADASPLSIGGTTVESTVCLYGVVSDPDNDQVKLQVELRNLNEYSGEFNEAAGGFKESEPVSSGNEAVAFANELIDESYHWRARTIDEHGLASDWVDFGGNGILEPDFIVRAGAQSSNKIRLSNSLKELKEAIRFKLLYDVGIVAQIFTSVKDYWRAKRWADIASVGLETIKDAFSIGTIPARLYDIITNPDPEYQKAKGALELASLLLMAQGIKRTGENLVTGLYGPSYTNTIHDMLDGSDQIFFFNYDAAVYRAFIDTYLKIPPPDKQSPLTVPRKSGDINRKTVGLTDGMIDVYMSISKTIRCLIDDVGRFDLPDSFPIEPVISELEQLETGIMRSCFPDQMGGTKIDWDTYLKDGESYIPQHMSMTFGKPAQLLSVFGLCAGSLADKSTVEIVNTFIKAGGAVVDAIQVYRMAKTNEIITVKSSYLSDVGMILSGASISTQLVLNTYYSDTEKQFYELPQEMLLTLPTEFSNVWMMVDDIDRCIRHEIDISPGTPESEIGGIVAKLGSPGVLQVCDSEGRVTGIVNGLTAEEIPNSECFNNTVIILWPNDTYCYRVIGTELGFYGLRVDSVAGDDAVSFSAADIPITEDAVHLFSIDWAALSLGEEGVTVQVDLDRNGVFERSLTSDSELARDEYVAAVFTADIDGDKIANMKDVSIAVNAFNSFPTQPRWNPYADLDTNSRIDMRDIVAIVLNFNRRYP